MSAKTPPVGERHAPGMDHSLYPYSPMPARPVLAWPQGARVAFWVLLHLEYWELDAPEGALRDPRFVGEFGSYFPDYRSWTQRDYGNRVGIFRVLELLDRYQLKVTVAANSSALERYPYLVAELKRRGYEFAAHGSHATRMITSRMSEAEERAAIASSIEAVERATGRRPTGWLGQDYGESERTPQLLAEAGLDYVMDWPNDDQPYRMTVGKPFVSIPNHAEWDDVQLLWLRRVGMQTYAKVLGEAFDALHEEGAQSGRLFGLSLHPWLIGMAHRIGYLDQALRHIAGHRDVWQATSGEIAAWYLEHGPRHELGRT
jgi:peptidoglycan/xylan/chitin deacetylase (PgdA/CDA1 family)